MDTSSLSTSVSYATPGPAAGNSTMHFIGACFYNVNYEMPPGYSLAAGDLAEIVRRLPGAPLTYEHSGIYSAVEESIRERGCIADVDDILRAAPDVASRPVGRVVLAYTDPEGSAWAVAAIDAGRFPRLCVAVTAGSLKSVSLTTFVRAGQPEPLELSLCAFPARPGSSVCWQARELQRAVAYKHLHASGGTVPTMDTPAPATAPAPTRVEKAISSMADPADQELLRARLVDVVTSLEAQEKRAGELQNQLEARTNEVKTLRVASAQDEKMFENEVKRFMANTAAKYHEPYGLSTCADQLVKTQDVNEMRTAVNRMLTVANRAHAERVTTDRHSTGEAAGKRARLAAPPEPVAEAADNRSPLQRAFSRTWA